MVYGVLQDPILLSALEADFLQYYQLDIHSFFRGEMFFRRLVDLVAELPVDSRVMKRLRNDPIDVSQHLMMNVVDGLNLLNFQSYYIASSSIGKEYRKAFQKAPKPQERPKFVEEKKKREFVSGAQLKAMMEGMKTRVIAHTDRCIKSKINEGGGTIRCSCPPEEIKKE